MVAHTTLLEISCRGSCKFCLFIGGYDIIEDFIQKTGSSNHLLLAHLSRRLIGELIV